ncbi:MAG: hypothetical protein H8D63_01405 [Parcubacteria group bacterium]|nr:hypothetical protein [Parcubacteria group bacterium]
MEKVNTRPYFVPALFVLMAIALGFILSQPGMDWERMQYLVTNFGNEVRAIQADLGL